MSMLSKLMGRIFGEKEDGVITAEATPTLAPEPAAGTVAEEISVPVVNDAAPTEGIVKNVPVAITVVDVEENLAAIAKENPEQLDWKRSIVDLLKLVGMDSSYGARKELALELGYSQAEIDSKGSAEMNMWLHKQVMKHLAENGATVPPELLD